MLIGYRSIKIAEAVEIGRWVRPHPDSEYALQGHQVESLLYERPGDDCIPTHVIDETEDIITKEKRRTEFEFVDPILGSSWECSGCGEPFGKQQRLRRGLHVSLDVRAYLTDQKSPSNKYGIMYFCADAYSCSKRAVDRVGKSAERQVLRAERKKISEVTGKDYDDTREQHGSHDGIRYRELPEKECRLQSCKKMFTPDTRTTYYCSNECRAAVAESRKSGAEKREKRKPGRPRKVVMEPDSV